MEELLKAYLLKQAKEREIKFNICNSVYPVFVELIRLDKFVIDGVEIKVNYFEKTKGGRGGCHCSAKINVWELLVFVNNKKIVIEY